MRLLKFDSANELCLTGDLKCKPPPYAILSHTWGRDEDEVTFQDVSSRTGEAKVKAGYSKIRLCGEQARKDGFGFFWVDTCTIDKTSSSELSEAINSMYQWYGQSAICYAYLADVDDETKFTQSRWFTRGWTLQELIAPRNIVFYDANWRQIGTKSTLLRTISNRTGIPAATLSSHPGSRDSVARKMSWASQRETTRVEDEAYCLLGIFGINMPLLYGEGTRAFGRLQEEILRQLNDHSLLAWCVGTPTSDFRSKSGDPAARLSYRPEQEYTSYTDNIPIARFVGALARSPKDFAKSDCIETFYSSLNWNFLVTNGGLKINLQVVSPSEEGKFSENFHRLSLGLLRCNFSDRGFKCVGVPLARTVDGIYHRVKFTDGNISTIPVPVETAVKAVLKEIYITTDASSKAMMKWVYGTRTDRSILVDAGPELDLDPITVYDDLGHQYEFDDLCNAVKLNLKHPPGKMSLFNHVAIMLYSARTSSVLTMLLQIPATFDEHGFRGQVLLCADRSDHPSLWSDSVRKAHLTAALEIGSYSSDAEPSGASEIDQGFIASLDVRDIVNQLIFVIHVSQRDQQGKRRSRS